MRLVLVEGLGEVQDLEVLVAHHGQVFRGGDDDHDPRDVVAR